MNGYNFTERVRKVLALARQSAARLHQEYVGTEHLLLSLIEEGEGVACTVMENLGGDLGRIRNNVEAAVSAGSTSSGSLDLPYTSRAKKVLELAMSEARRLSHSYVGTEHLLLGLLAEKKGIAAQVLVDAGITLDLARAETLRILGSPSQDDERGSFTRLTAFVGGRPEPSTILVELHFEDGSTKRRECRDRYEAIRFLADDAASQ